MNILVTGATGFLGSYLIKALLQKDHNIAIVKRSFSNLSRVGEILHAVKSFDVDLTSISEIVEQFNPHAVIHLATNYGKNGASTSEVFNDNIIFPLQIMENLQPGTYFINTDTYFNNNNSYKYSYLNSYCLSKKYFLETAQSYIASKQLVLINARLEHIYGPLDDPSKFTMNIIRQLYDNQSPIALTLGEQRRDFIYVDDVVSAYLNIIESLPSLSGNYSEFQIGTGDTCSIRHFVELSKELCASTSELLFGKLPYRENEILTSEANISSLVGLGWRPRVDLKEGIIRMVNQLDRQKVVVADE
ncbi:NAD-dependent epimerase/dehydratase family protein [Cohnella terricola]|uniref:NAD(P)-dependent oxidoreductase n=1 Tax=Cohnella terricola TaxID=1289167 RepID=A0A559JB15_9BACL|nr:NAD(P)-dependent oxidoreductase [Cohnella terricola]TVX97066.1 NAD(P)-dependent oxidoreductase [Cohnella terricola]